MTSLQESSPTNVSTSMLSSHSLTSSRVASEKRRALASIALVAGLGMSFAAQAQSVQGNGALPPAPEALKAAQSQGFKAVSHFAVSAEVSGWVLVSASEPMQDPVILYVTRDGKYGFPGPLLDSAGRNLTERHLQQFAPKPDFGSFVAKLAAAPSIPQGPASGRVVYAFFDPTCPYCNVAYQSFAKEPRLKVQWIPVAFLSQKSAGQAAAMMMAADPVAAMAEHEATFRSGGLSPVAAIPADVSKKLADNLSLFREMGFKGVPAVIYKNQQGVWAAEKGAPNQATIARMLGK